jgi:hypothetical protein
MPIARGPGQTAGPAAPVQKALDFRAGKQDPTLNVNKDALP